MLLRLVADTILIGLGTAVGSAARMLYVLTVEMKRGDDPFRHVSYAFHSYLQAIVPLTILLLAIFWFNGFYTYSKNYLSRYKALVIFQAVSIGFLVYGFLSYFLGGDLAVPRSALVIGWMMTSILLIGARLWNGLWNHLVVPERESVLRDRRPIRHILVIGGGGYIGSALVPLLLREQYRVRVLDVMLFGDAPLAKFLHHPNLQLVRGDFRNIETVYQSMEGIDAVVHLGGIVGDPACKLDENLTVDINLISTRVIAEVAKSRDVRRFIFASTCSVYGASDEWLDERSETRPLSLYGRTKVASERVLMEMGNGGFAPVILRFATIYGLSGRTRFDLVVNLLTARARLDGEITIHGGNQWRPFVHVEDAARGVLAALAAPHEVVAHQIFNVGSDEQNYTITQIGEFVQQRVHDARIVVEAESVDPRNYRVSFRKIHQHLDYVPQWSLNDGIQQVLEAIATGEIADYEDPRYSNAKYLSAEGTTKLAQHQWATKMLQEMHDYSESQPTMSERP